MYKLITAALLGAALAAPLMAQGYPGDDGRHDRGAPGQQGDRPDDRREAGDRRGPGDQRGPDDRQRGGNGYQGQGGPDRGQYRGDDRARPDQHQPYGGNGGPGRGPGYDRGPVVGDRGRPGGDGRHWEGPGRGGPGGGWHDDRGQGRFDQGRYGQDHNDRGQNGRGWDQRWRSDNRYDWQGYRAGHRDRFQSGAYYAPGGYGYRRFERGYRIGPAFYDQRYWILDPYAYRLPPAEGPYRWVRYFDDVLLIDLRSGLVVDEVPGFFY